MAILVASATFLQSISQNLALTWGRNFVNVESRDGWQTYRGGEVDTVADEVKRGAASHVLPLGPGGAA